MSNQAKKSYLRIVKRKYKNQNHVTKGQILDQGVIHCDDIADELTHN